MYNKNLVLKPQPIKEHQKMILRGPIHESNNRPTFYVLQILEKINAVVRSLRGLAIESIFSDKTCL